MKEESIEKKKITVELPSIESLERIRVKLETPRPIYKNRKDSDKTFFPLELRKHEQRKGVYIILDNKKVVYVGATLNLYKRIMAHSFLRRNPHIINIYFLQVDNKIDIPFFELVYKYRFFGKAKIEYYPINN